MFAALLAVMLAGCAGGGRSGSDQPGVAAEPSTAAGPAGAAQRTSIGTASEPDVAAALRANDVTDPERLAQLVIQYRPYPAGDPGQGKLRQMLVRFKTDPGDIAKITNALTP